MLERRELLTATVDGLHLVNDTGVSGTDLITSDPQVTGVVNGNAYGTYTEVQFDNFANGTVDSSTYVYYPGQSFTYDPRSCDSSLSGYMGSFTLTYRATEYDWMHNIASQGDWQSFSFTLVPPANPQMSVSYVDPQYGYNSQLSDGMSSVSFGSTALGAPVGIAFNIANTGTGPLTLDASSLTVPSGFSVVTPFASAVAPGMSTTFAVQLDATFVGSYQGRLSFTDNDPNQNPFDFQVSGDVAAPAAALAVSYVGAYGYGSDLYDGMSLASFGTTTAGVPVTSATDSASVIAPVPALRNAASTRLAGT